MVKRTIKLLFLVQIPILFLYFISFEFYINVQIAFLSSFFIIVGSTYAYSNMINTQVQADMVNEQRDILDTIEDPHELYDNEPINQAPVEELDLKEIIKQEKKKIKILNLKDMKKGSKAGFSPFRLVPYAFLILSFIALKNNELLVIKFYLPSLMIGIVFAYYATKNTIKTN